MQIWYAHAVIKVVKARESVSVLYLPRPYDSTSQKWCTVLCKILQLLVFKKNILFPKSQTCLFFKRFWAGLLKVFKSFSLDICWSLTHFQSLYLTNFRRIFVCLFAWWIAQQGVCQPLNHWSIKKHLQNIFLETYLEVDYYWQGLFRI